MKTTKKQVRAIIIGLVIGWSIVGLFGCKKEVLPLPIKVENIKDKIPVDRGTMERYTIYKKFHYSYHSIVRFDGIEGFNSNFQFNSNCRYDLGNQNQGDINKLFGCSFGSDNHYNSVRVGWNYNISTDMIDLWYYAYERGIPTHIKIGSTNIDQYNDIQIYFDYSTNRVLLFLQSSTTGIARAYDYIFPSERWGYYQYPYFGGDEKAPHRMDILLYFNRY
ncbi:MAG: hypothetical protein ABI241_00410 [Bacteroidia bacterium]